MPVSTIDKPRKFPPGCGPNAPHSAASLRRLFSNLVGKTCTATAVDAAKGGHETVLDEAWSLKREQKVFETETSPPVALNGAFKRCNSFGGMRSCNLGTTTTSIEEEEEKSRKELQQREQVKKKLNLLRAKQDELIIKAKHNKSSPNHCKKESCTELQALRILKAEGKINEPNYKTLGPIPGVKIGDEFFNRVELTIVGIHSQSRRGIDYKEYHSGNVTTTVATCVVATGGYTTGGYTNKMKGPGVLTYIGEGGHLNYSMSSLLLPADQKLKRGNLALKNSMLKKTPVRVLRGVKKIICDVNARSDPSSRGMRYVYDGLYVVSKYEKKKSSQGNAIYEFELRRMPDQKTINWSQWYTW